MNMNEMLLLDAEFWLLSDDGSMLEDVETTLLNAIYISWGELENWYHLDDETCSWLALLIREAEFSEGGNNV